MAALNKPTTIQELATVTQQEISIANDGVSQLQAITPPSDVQAKYDQYLSEVKSQIADAGQIVDAAKAGDTAKVQQLAQQFQGNSPDPEARALGLTECAKDVSPSG